MIMKTTKEKIEVMQAYEIGEKIEVRYLYDHKDYWIACGTPIWDWNNFDYRIKPKKIYVPFDTPEEFLTAYRKHGEFIENKESGEKMNAYVDKNGIVILSTALNCTYTFESLRTLFGCYQFSDGTPCGKEIEECQH